MVDDEEISLTYYEQILNQFGLLLIYIYIYVYIYIYIIGLLILKGSIDGLEQTQINKKT